MVNYQNRNIIPKPAFLRTKTKVKAPGCSPHAVNTKPGRQRGKTVFAQRRMFNATINLKGLQGLWSNNRGIFTSYCGTVMWTLN